VPYPVVAIVGYTNAGKSTLFNRLTGAEVLAEDMLFATLDPTLRRLRLPHGTPIILSDTVGFISDLPTHLVAAFRATLEEVVEADLVLHLRDISDPDTAAQADDVERILADLGVDATDEKRVVEVWNKIDRLDDGNRERLLAGDDARPEPPIAISAVTGEGLETLKAVIEAKVSGELQPVTVTLAPAELGLVNWLYRNGDIVSRIDNEDGSVTISLNATQSAREEIEAKLHKKHKG
jgi:GTP-binding protein HflX